MKQEMKKMEKQTAKRGNRLLALLLSVMMVLTLVPASAFAEDETTPAASSGESLTMTVEVDKPAANFTYKVKKYFNQSYTEEEMAQKPLVLHADGLIDFQFYDYNYDKENYLLVGIDFYVGEKSVYYDLTAGGVSPQWEVFGEDFSGWELWANSSSFGLFASTKKNVRMVYHFAGGDGYQYKADYTNENGVKAMWFSTLENGADQWKLTAESTLDGDPFGYWTWTSASDPTGANGEKVTTNPLMVELTENRTYTAHYQLILTPEIQLSDDTYTATFTKSRQSIDTDGTNQWKVSLSTTSKKYLKLLHLEDEAGNEYASTDGRSVVIPVTAKGQVFTAYVEKSFTGDFPHMVASETPIALSIMTSVPYNYIDPVGATQSSTGSLDSSHQASEGHRLGGVVPLNSANGYGQNNGNVFAITYAGDSEPAYTWTSYVGNSASGMTVPFDVAKLRAAEGKFTVTYSGTTKIGESFSSSMEYTADLDSLLPANVNDELQQLNTSTRDPMEYVGDVMTVTDSATQVTTIYVQGYDQLFVRDTTRDAYTTVRPSGRENARIYAFTADENNAYALIYGEEDGSSSVELMRLTKDYTLEKVEGATFSVGGKETFEGWDGGIQGMTLEDGKIHVFGSTSDAVWDGTQWTNIAHPDGLSINCASRWHISNHGVFDIGDEFIAASSNGGLWKYSDGTWGQLTWSTNEGSNEGYAPTSRMYIHSVTQSGNVYVQDTSSRTFYRIAVNRLTDSACVKAIPLDTRYVDQWDSSISVGEDFNGKIYVMTETLSFLRNNSSWAGAYLYSVDMSTGLWTLENVGGDFYDSNEGGMNLHPCEIMRIFNPTDKLTVFGAMSGLYAIDQLPVGSVELDQIKAVAKEELASYFESMTEDNYSDEAFAQVKAAYEAGLTAIDGAEDMDAVKSARDAAKAAMKAVQADRQSTKTVWVSFSDDGKFLLGSDPDTTVLGAMQVTVDYFDLADYGLAGFYRYDDDGQLVEQPTALHLYIKMLEKYYLGYTDGEKLVPGVTVKDGAENKALLITGTSSSMYMKNFWGHDENLTYFVNHEYPTMRPGWGSTADWILLQNDDYVELAMYSDWGFFRSENAGFHYFADMAGENVTELSTASGELQLRRATADMNGGGSYVIVKEKPVYYVSAANFTEDVTQWTQFATTDAEGKFAYDFAGFTPGDYYIGTPGSTVNAPAAIRVHIGATVTFDANGGECDVTSAVADPATGLLASLPTAQREGWRFDGWFTAAEGGAKVEADHVFTDNVTLFAHWTKIEIITPVGPSQPSKPSEPSEPVTPTAPIFTDVAESDWFYDGVKYVSDKGLMNGTGANTFAPAADTTRGMIVTILARMEGVDTTKGDTWYAAGREWAMANGVSDGTNMPGKITREQLAAMLYRYAQSKGYDVSAAADLSTYADGASVSSWALDAMQWAVGSGLMQGSGNSLNPQANATRAEVAAILMRFAQNLAK